MRVGVFTALLANLPLDQVIAKLKTLGVNTVELGTGNYPGEEPLPGQKQNKKDQRKEKCPADMVYSAESPEK